MLAQHPDLLAPPEQPTPRNPGLRAARCIFEAVGELHAALDNHRAFLPADHPQALGDEPPGDDIPF